MTCRHCGTELADNARFCNRCGKPLAEAAPPPSALPPQPPAQQTPPADPVAAAAPPQPQEPVPPPPAYEPAAGPVEAEDAAPPPYIPESQPGAQPQPTQEPVYEPAYGPAYTADAPPPDPAYAAPPPDPAGTPPYGIPSQPPLPPSGPGQPPIQQPRFYQGPPQEGVPPIAYGPQPYTGEPVAQIAAPPKKSRKPLFLILGGVAVLLALVAVLVVVLVGGGSSALRVKADYLARRQDDNLIFIDRETVSVLDFGEFDSGSYERSMDGSVLLVYEEDGDDAGILWYLTASDKVKISDDVYAYVLADGGAAVAYLTDYSTRSDSGRLSLFTAKSRGSERIADDVVEEGLCLSPDGKIVAYVDDEAVGWLHNGGERVELGEELLPVAVSDGAKYVYYLNRNGFYVRSGGEDTKLSSESGWELSLTFSADYAQVIFRHNDRVYISRQGGDRERLSATPRMICAMPAGIQYAFKFTSSYYAQVLGVADFAGSVFYDADGAVWYVERDYSTTKLGEMGNGYLARTGDDKVYFLDEADNLVVCDLRAKEREAQTLVRRVREFGVSMDGGQLYYIDKDDRLYRYDEEDGDALASGVDVMLVTDNGVFYTLVEDDALYHSADDAVPAALAEVEEIVLIRMNKGVCYHAGGERYYDLYYTDGGAPELLAEDCANYSAYGY